MVELGTLDNFVEIFLDNGMQAKYIDTLKGQYILLFTSDIEVVSAYKFESDWDIYNSAYPPNLVSQSSFYAMGLGGDIKAANRRANAEVLYNYLNQESTEAADASTTQNLIWFTKGIDVYGQIEDALSVNSEQIRFYIEGVGSVNKSGESLEEEPAWWQPYKNLNNIEFEWYDNDFLEVYNQRDVLIGGRPYGTELDPGGYSVTKNIANIYTEFVNTYPEYKTAEYREPNAKTFWQADDVYTVPSDMQAVIDSRNNDPSETSNWRARLAQGEDGSSIFELVSEEKPNLSREAGGNYFDSYQTDENGVESFVSGAVAAQEAADLLTDEDNIPRTVTKLPGPAGKDSSGRDVSQYFIEKNLLSTGGNQIQYGDEAEQNIKDYIKRSGKRNLVAIPVFSDDGTEAWTYEESSDKSHSYTMQEIENFRVGGATVTPSEAYDNRFIVDTSARNWDNTSQGKNYAQQYLQRNGLLESHKITPGLNGLEVEALDDYLGDIYLTEASAARNTPPGFQTVARWNPDGTQTWGFERTPEEEGPGNFDELVFSVAMSQGGAAALEVDAFRDRVNAAQVSFGQAAQLAVQYGKNATQMKSIMSVLLAPAAAFDSSAFDKVMTNAGMALSGMGNLSLTDVASQFTSGSSTVSGGVGAGSSGAVINQASIDEQIVSGNDWWNQVNSAYSRDKRDTEYVGGLTVSSEDLTEGATRTSPDGTVYKFVPTEDLVFGKAAVGDWERVSVDNSNIQSASPMTVEQELSTPTASSSTPVSEQTTDGSRSVDKFIESLNLTPETKTRKNTPGRTLSEYGSKG